MSLSRRQRRMVWVLLLLMGVGGAVALAITAFQQNLMYFRTPSDIAQGHVQPNIRLTLGGLVKAESVRREETNLDVVFTLKDCESEVDVQYSGILPDLFREGQGIVVRGKLNPAGTVIADEVLAKHDENYMPPELAEELMSPDGHSCAPFKAVGEA